MAGSRGGGGGVQTPPEHPGWGSQEGRAVPGPHGLGLGRYGLGSPKPPQSPRHPLGPTGPSPTPWAPSPLSGGAAEAICAEPAAIEAAALGARATAGSRGGVGRERLLGRPPAEAGWGRAQAPVTTAGGV